MPVPLLNWLQYADPRVAPLWRSRPGSITPIFYWLRHGRSPSGSNVPVGDTASSLRGLRRLRIALQRDRRATLGHRPLSRPAGRSRLAQDLDLLFPAVKSSKIRVCSFHFALAAGPLAAARSLCDAITFEKTPCAIVGESFRQRFVFYYNLQKPSYAAAEPFIGQYPG